MNKASMEKNKKSFSQYLLDEGLISKEQLEKGLALQNKDRLFGTLARELGVLSEEDILRINGYQESNNVPFGEAAISLGLLTSNQLKYLLDVRLRRKIRIGDILVTEGFLSKENLYNALMHFEKNRRRLKKILVCDSSHLVNKLLSDILKKYQYHVKFTENPEEAIQIAIRERPGLLIISQVFEGMSGLDASSRLLSMQDMADLHIIFMAQNIDKNLVEEAFKAGIHHFLKKPIEEYELLNIIYNIEQKEQIQKKEKILVVEDSELIRQIIARELRQYGYNVLQAANGEKGLAIAKIEKPDLITLDVIMPGIDGYETCKRLREDPETQDIPVIMVTSRDTQEERIKGFETGAVEYFVKPFVPNQLANYIKVLFETKKARRKEKALVIEDTKTTRHIIKHILEKQGLKVFTAENGKVALDMMKRVAPDIILSDIYMPVMDGFQVCHEVKKSPETSPIPFVFLTSSGKKDDILKGLALGANDYLTKPFDEDELLARVNNLLTSKRLYEELKSLNNQLERQNDDLEKLHREKETFYSILTHDLRSPLTSVLGFSNMLIEGHETTFDESVLGSLKIIRSAAERQLGIIEDALEIFQFEKGKELEMEKGDLGGVAHDVIETHLQEVKEKKMEITVNGKPFSPKDRASLVCSFNRSKISRVIENLIGNALKYAKNSIDLSYESKGNFVEVRVRDDGEGMPEKYVDKIFQDFFQIPGSQKGTGLGLSSAKRIVEAHTGRIWVDPSPGRCSFHFTLPL